MDRIDFGQVGILQIGNYRYGFRPMEIYTEYGHAPIMKGEFLSGVFEASNLKAKAIEHLKSFDLAVPQIKNVVFNDPATVVMWSDGTKTVVKCQPGDSYSKETGLALCIAKKFLGNKSNFNEVFKRWIPEDAKIGEEKFSVDGDLRVGLIGVRSYNGFSIGDIVKITNSGQHYSTYSDWVDKNVNPGDRAKWYWRKKPYRYLHDGDIGVIKAIAPHGNHEGDWLAYVEIDGICYIVNFRGLSKI